MAGPATRSRLSAAERLIDAGIIGGLLVADVSAQIVVSAGGHAPSASLGAEAHDGDQAITVVRHLRPAVVVMDVRMPGRDGLSATAQLIDEVPDLRVSVLTTFDLDEYLFGALRAGAAGFRLKNTAPEDLACAVMTVAWATASSTQQSLAVS